MKILVCFKAVPVWEKILEDDWKNFSTDRDIKYAGTELNCFDESALELALRLKSEALSRGDTATITALTVAAGLSASLTETLYASGFDSVVHIQDPEPEFCSARIAARLSEFASEKGYDLILTGTQAGCADSSLVPCMLAEKLALPHLQDVQELSLSEHGVNIVQLESSGLWQREFELPALISVGNSPAVLRAVSLRTRMAAKGKRPELIESPAAPATEPPQLSRPKTVRSLSILEGDDETDSARLVLNEIKTSLEEAGPEPEGEISLPDSIYTVCCDDGLSLERMTVVLGAVTPDLTLLRDTPQGRALAAAIAERSGASLLSGVKILNVESGGVQVSKRVCASNLDWTQFLRFPAVLTTSGPLPKSAITLDEQRSEASLAKRSMQPSEFIAPLRGTARSEKLLEPPRERSLQNPDCVVICGRGVGSAAACAAARELAACLGAGFGLTRSAALCGWGSTDEIIGMSGSKISPKCALVLGASGAAAFYVGIENAGVIFAVNSDPRALIFRGADFGLFSDAPSFVEQLLSVCKKEG